MRINIMRMFWVFIGVIIAVVAVGIAVNVLFFAPANYNGTYGYYGYGPYGMMGGGFGGGGWFIWPIMMIIPLILLFFFIFWIFEISTGYIRGSRYGDNTSESNKTAQEILDQRYATGAITREEYQKIKDEITKR